MRAGWTQPLAFHWVPTVEWRVTAYDGGQAVEEMLIIARNMGHALQRASQLFPHAGEVRVKAV